MFAYVIKSGSRYVKTTNYGVEPEIIQLKEKAEKEGKTMVAESYTEAIDYQLREQVFTDNTDEALKFDTEKEAEDFFSRNCDDYLAQWNFELVKVFIKG